MGVGRAGPDRMAGADLHRQATESGPAKPAGRGPLREPHRDPLALFAARLPSLERSGSASPDLTPARARIHHLTCEIGDAKRTPEQQHSVGQELLAVMRHGEEGGSTDRATRLAEAIHIPAGSPRSTSSSAATAGQAPVVHEPSQGPLNGPAAGQNGKSPGGGVAADDVHVDAGGGGVLDEVLAVATVDPGLCSSSNQVSWLAQSSRWRNSTLASAPECA